MKKLVLACCVALSLLAVGCGKKQSDAKAVSTGEKQELNLYTWSDYFPKEMLKEFTDATGIKVNETKYSTNEEMMAKLAAGGSGYDLVIPSDYAVQALIEQKQLLPLDRSTLSNFKNLDPKLLGLPYDKDNKYSLPVYWGTTGLGINKDVIKEPIDSWNALFDPKYAGKISMLNDARENFAIALKVMGKSLNDRDSADLKQAGEKLKEQAKLVKSYDSESFDEKLRTGEAALVHGYNGQLAKVVRDDPKKFAYIVPKEGATRWVDNACIPADAPHPKNAHVFLNYMLEAKNAAAMTNDAGYASGNKAAQQFVDEKLLKDPNVYVPDDVMKRCEFMLDIGTAGPAMQKMFEEAKAK